MALARDKKRLLLIFFVFLAAMRASLLGSGAMTFLDEDRYLYSFEFLNAITHFEFKLATLNLSNIDARPGDIVFRTFPALIQIFVSRLFNIPLMGQNALLIPTIFNLFFSLANSYLLFLIGLNIFRNDFWKAFIATVFYSFLVNTNLYIRHISAHDHALFFFLLSTFFLVQKPKINSKLSFYAGLTAGGIITLYPGYYPSALILGILVIRRSTQKAFVNHLGGLAILPLFFQCLTYIGDQPYFQEVLKTREAQQLDREGTFNEAFAFLFKYLFEIESFPGIILAIGTILFVIQLLKTKDKSDSIQLLGIGLVLTYLIHGSVGLIFQKWVFYGRLLHLYFPIMVLMAIHSLSQLRIKDRQVYGIIIIFSFVQFSFFLNSFRQILYPKDIVERMHLHTQATFLSEYDNCEYTFFLRSLHLNGQKKADTVFVNFCRIKPLEKKPLIIRNLDLLLSVDHFLAFKPYQFEGYSIKERNQFQKDNLKMYIYSVRGAGFKPKT